MSTSCKRLSASANRRILAVLLILLLLMVLRYWHVGDHIGSVALAAVFFTGAVNFALRFLKRREPPSEFKERYTYVFLAGVAVDATIFGFVAIRSWQRDGSLFLSGLCGAIALTVAFVSTFGTVMYFRSRKRTDVIAPQIIESS